MGYISEETKQKISNIQLGKIVSETTKQKMSEARRGEKNHRSKKVYQYAPDGTLLGSFGSSEEAARQLKKKDGSGIIKCARGKYNTAYGFRWSYENSM